MCLVGAVGVLGGCAHPAPGGPVAVAVVTSVPQQALPVRVPTVAEGEVARVVFGPDAPAPSPTGPAAVVRSGGEYQLTVACTGTAREASGLWPAVDLVVEEVDPRTGEVFPAEGSGQNPCDGRVRQFPIGEFGGHPLRVRVVGVLPAEVRVGYALVTPARGS